MKFLYEKINESRQESMKIMEGIRKDQKKKSRKIRRRKKRK